jgi:uncharacterized membrane protein
MLKRWFQNLFTTPLALGRAFPPEVLAEIDQVVTDSEQSHTAEIRVAVETALSPGDLWRSTTARQRARQVFAEIGVWDTAANNGVLLYVLLAERDIEIVADRGFAGRVSDGEWEAICQEMEAAFRSGRYREGTLSAVARIGALAARHFPAAGANADELPNRPLLL